MEDKIFTEPYVLALDAAIRELSDRRMFDGVCGLLADIRDYINDNRSASI